MSSNNYQKLADLIFPDVTMTIEDLDKKYPVRALGSGAMVTRFAPSPTGFLHTGSLFATLINHKLAKQSNGVFFIRLEDTDTKREIAGSGESLLKQLEMFDLLPTEGYMGDCEVGNYGPYRQSERSQLYRTVIKYLVSINRAYPCFCSAEEVQNIRVLQESKKENPGYYGKYAKCAFLSSEEAMEKIKNNEPYVIRFRSKGDALNKVKAYDLIRGELELSENNLDIVILKGDGLPTYHFAHLVDDHFMRTTHVVRGEEWLSSLPIHIELFDTMKWVKPNYAHLPVIMKLDNGNRRKLSKRKDPEAAVSFFLEEGYPEEGFLEYLLTIANSNFEEWRLQNMEKSAFEFNLTFEKMNLDGALFDLAKVESICKERLSRLNKDDITAKAYAYGKRYQQELCDLIDRNIDYFKQIINIEREKENPRKDYVKYSDILPKINFFYDDYFQKEITNELPFNPVMSKELIKEMLADYQENLNLDLSEEEWFNALKDFGAKFNFCPNVKEYKKNKEAYVGHIGDVSEIIRIAISGRKNTPNLYYVLKILGKEKIKERFNQIISIL